MGALRVEVSWRAGCRNIGRLKMLKFCGAYIGKGHYHVNEYYGPEVRF